MQPYLLPSSNLTNTFSNFVFLARCRMLDMKSYYKGSHQNLNCNLCSSDKVPNERDPHTKYHEDSQQHLLLCDEMNQNEVVNPIHQGLMYEDLFSVDILKQIQLAIFLKSRFELRKKLLHEKQNSK